MIENIEFEDEFCFLRLLSGHIFWVEKKSCFERWVWNFGLSTINLPRTWIGLQLKTKLNCTLKRHKRTLSSITDIWWRPWFLYPSYCCKRHETDRATRRYRSSPWPCSTRRGRRRNRSNAHRPVDLARKKLMYWVFWFLEILHKF